MGSDHTKVKLFETCLSSIFHTDISSAALTLLGPSRRRRDAASALESPFLEETECQRRALQQRTGLGSATYCKSTPSKAERSVTGIVWAYLHCSSRLRCFASEGAWSQLAHSSSLLSRAAGTFSWCFKSPCERSKADPGCSSFVEEHKGGSVDSSTSGGEVSMPIQLEFCGKRELR